MTSQNTDQERAEFEAWSQANDKYHVSGYNPHNDLWEAWQAARSAPAAPEPHGWKLVPIEPTEAQLWCLYGRFVGQLTTEAKLYSDMLAAAPQPASQVPQNLLAELERIAEKYAWTFQDAGTETYAEQVQAKTRKAKQALTAELKSALAIHPPTQQGMEQVIKWPKARDVGRFGDMSPDAFIRVGLDADNDVYVSICDGNSVSDIEFCTPGGGGGRSSRTRMALIALMCAIEADNASHPSFDFWQRNIATQAKQGEQANG